MRYLIFLMLILIPAVTHADLIIDHTVVHEVAKGDTLKKIGARYGVHWKSIAAKNRINRAKPLKKGLRLSIPIKKIVPKVVDNGIIVNIPERMLYFFRNGRLVDTFPVGLGMPSWNGLTRWRTPVGKFKVLSKERNPIWYVPESIQWKMEMEGKQVITSLPPGPNNPLGRYKITTSFPTIDIHETIQPSSISRFMSHGCIRLLPEHMERLFEEVEINTTGEVLYIPIKLARSPEGRIFLEVHRDIYGKVYDMEAEARVIINEADVAAQVDWEKVDRLLHQQSGRTEDITFWRQGEIS